MQRTLDLVKTYLEHNQVSPRDLPGLIEDIFNKIHELEDQPNQSDLKPPVPIEESIGDDYIVCLEDGKPVKLLRRYLKQHFGMEVEDYLKKWNLPSDYPLVPANYRKQRSRLAKKQGLGKKAA